MALLSEREIRDFLQEHNSRQIEIEWGAPFLYIMHPEAQSIAKKMKGVNINLVRVSYPEFELEASSSAKSFGLKRIRVQNVIDYYSLESTNIPVMPIYSEDKSGFKPFIKPENIYSTIDNIIIPS